MVSFESQMSSRGTFRCVAPNRPRTGELRLFCPLLQLPIGVAKHPAVRIVREKRQHALLAAAAFGDVMLLDEGILTMEGNGMEVEIEGDPMGKPNVLTASCH